MKTFALGAAVVSVLALGAVSVASADTAQIIKYRQNLMKSNGAHLGGIFAVLKGEVPFKGNIAHHAEVLHHISMMVPAAFPAGSGEGDTRAMADIWTDGAKFEAAAKAFQDQTSKLVEVAKGDDMKAIGAQAGAVGKTCGGCYKPFRAEKK